MFFDAKEHHAANKQVANILSSDNKGSSNQTSDATAPGKGDKQEVVEEATLDNMDGAQWGDEED